MCSTLCLSCVFRASATHQRTFQYNVNAVPTFLFLQPDGSILDRIDGGEDVARVTQSFAKLASASSAVVTTESSPSAATTSEQQSPLNNNATDNATNTALTTRLQSLITSSPIMLFLKGTPTSPKCGFSRQAVELLTSCNLSFGYFNILEDEDVRQGLKKYSDWPTYPQLYVRGELAGGLDIMKEMAEDEGGLVSGLGLENYQSSNGATLATDASETALNNKLSALVNRHKVMLFMKGIPSSPRCGFSRQIVEILDSYNVSYDAFNILEDEEVRQGLKVYSDWPTYPQLYCGGELVGGLDIVQEMQESGDLKILLEG